MNPRRAGPRGATGVALSGIPRRMSQIKSDRFATPYKGWAATVTAPRAQRRVEGCSNQEFAMRSSSPQQAQVDGAAGAGPTQDQHGPALRVPAELLNGERKNEEQPCLTPIDCVLENHCAGHCGCR